MELEKDNAFTEDELKRIMDLPKSIEQDMLLKTLYYTAARVSEICGTEGLTPNSIDKDNNRIRLRNLKNRKISKRCVKCEDMVLATRHTCHCGGQEFTIIQKKPRYKIVYVPKFFIEELTNYIKESGIEPNQRVFVMSRFTIWRIVHKICADVGINMVGKRMPHPHNFRHTYVTINMRKGADLKFMQNQTGHASIAMLSEYMGLKEKESQKQIKKLFGEPDKPI
jgi:integrase